MLVKIQARLNSMTLCLYFGYFAIVNVKKRGLTRFFSTVVILILI